MRSVSSWPTSTSADLASIAMIGGETCARVHECADTTAQNFDTEKEPLMKTYGV
eukprot:CAMPEP_0119095084 /NCGR_PEP_ID=MMETSP1178-20130426/168417_1 /TAXON_ID=33656 /ORGANISM="unid sp, Strain CCMP2000" /LENGTH=53 /DNA_ID=CAMNT_0007078869 /DNA_START=31 /DNA_END=188 /DNA_ORIENTATION=+